MDEVIGTSTGREDRRKRLGFRGAGPHLTSIAIVAFALLSPGSIQQQASHAEANSPSEYEVKAAFLLNFTKFVEWPKESSASANLAICVLAPDPFGATLDLILQGEQVNGRKLLVERVSRAQSTCAVLFISKAEKNVAPLLAETGRGVLTVGESEDFLKQGGMISFSVENRRVRFDVNHRAILQAGLQVSSRLLNVARTVEK